MATSGVPATGRRLRLPPRAASTGRAAAALVGRHRGLAVLLAAAVLLRIAALVAVYPGIWFSDSNDYIRTAATGTLSWLRPMGYALFVAPFWHLGSAATLIVVQHLLAVGIVVLLYALLRRRGVPKLLSLLAVVPAALDAYLVAIEHTIMSETVFHAALVGALALLLWTERPSLPAAAGAGLLLGYAGITRSVALPFIAIFVVYLLVRRTGWKSVVAFVVPAVLVLAAYGLVFKDQNGKFAMSYWGPRFLYGRVAPLADCSKLGSLPANQRSLCPDPKHRLDTNHYVWSPESPIHGLPPSANPRIRSFALRVIENRPFAYARTVAQGVLHNFEPGHRIGRNDYTDAVWQFPTDPARATYPGYRGPIRPGSKKRASVIDPSQYVSNMVGRPRTNATASKLLHFYQRYAYTSGQILALCLLVVLVALVRRRGGFRLRLDAALIATLILAAFVIASAVSLSSYRYGLVGVILLPAAAALAGTAMLEGTRWWRPARPEADGREP